MTAIGNEAWHSKARIFLMVLIVSGLYAPLPPASARPFLSRDWWTQEWSILMGSLPKGTETPSGASGCTSNPNNHGGLCPSP
ncbi:hypothetical protein HPP92_016633 [Vanilla planifolia]|uniref:Uncharacterized protein n=1 Tax=Vanilla planifolia TaxID=51239 RepID=A0A835QEG3_VANPL|nr:hypothetical protein HPP92_016633 [Vanilla planifolia]